MTKPWQRPLIRACKNNILEILREIDAAGDIDLWEEADGKLTDVILTYRRSQKAKAEPATFTFCDGVTRGDDYPAFLMRGERGA